MLIYILFILLILMFVVIYTKIDKDIFSPALLFVLTYIVSVGCAVCNVKLWNIKMAPVTFCVLLLGTLEFVGISLYISSRYRVYEKKIIQRPLKEIELSWWKIILTDTACAGYMVLLYCNVIAIAGRHGTYENLSEALAIFKKVTTETLTDSLPWWLGQVERLAMLCGYIFMYIVIRNIIAQGRKMSKKQIAKNICCIIPILLHLCNGFLVGDRLQMLQIIVGGVIICFLMWSYKTGKRYISLKTIGILAVCACAGLVLFYFSASLIGRVNTKGLWEYITFYCGCSIECLNQFFKNPPMPSNIFGKETLYNLNLKLYTLGLLDLKKFYSIHLEFRYYGDVMVGNVYTAYRRWIYDFGFVGAIILQGVMAAVMSIFYNKLKYRKVRNIGFWLILYSYLAYTVVFHPIDGYFYVQYVSQTFITTVILIWLMYWFFVNMKIEYKNGLIIHINKNIRIEKFHLVKSKPKAKEHAK